MLSNRDLYWHMTKISETYAELKTSFDNFYQFAGDLLTEERCPVKGISFYPHLAKNYFDVSFAGRQTRYSFLVAEDEKASVPSLRGFVKCNEIGIDKKPVEPIIGEFSFNRHCETTMMTPDGDGDPLYIHIQWQAAYIVLNLLKESFGKK